MGEVKPVAAPIGMSAPKGSLRAGKPMARDAQTGEAAAFGELARRGATCGAPVNDAAAGGQLAKAGSPPSRSAHAQPSGARRLGGSASGAGSTLPPVRAAMASMPLRIAGSRRERLVGLLHATHESGLLMLCPCRDIHTVGMSYSLDVAFVDEQGTVVAAYRSVPPGRRLRCRRAIAVFERLACGKPWYESGDRVFVCPSSSLAADGFPMQTRPASSGTAPRAKAELGSNAGADKKPQSQARADLKGEKQSETRHGALGASQLEVRRESPAEAHSAPQSPVRFAAQSETPDVLRSGVGKTSRTSAPGTAAHRRLAVKGGFVSPQNGSRRRLRRKGASAGGKSPAVSLKRRSPNRKGGRAHCGVPDPPVRGRCQAPAGTRLSGPVLERSDHQ